MLSQPLADILQLITFPLELLGLSLAIIEIRFPELAQRIDQFIAREAALVSEGMAQNPGPSSFQELLTPTWRKAGLMLVLLPWVLGALFLAQSGLTSAAFWILSAPLIAVVGGIIAGIGLWQLYLFVRGWVPGRTVGTMGLLIAGIGVLGEGYQFAVQILL